MAIFDSVLEGKPILILTVIMALLAGIVMWMLVRIEFLYDFLNLKCSQKSVLLFRSPLMAFML